MSASAQTVTGSLYNTTRIESWSYFAPYPFIDDPGDPTYTFFADRADIGVRVEGVRFDVAGAFNYVRLENLPPNSIGPGGLGSGAFYFGASGLPYSYQLYMSGLSLGIKSLDGRAAVVIGRTTYSSGLESRSQSDALEALKQERIAGRLVGNAEWSEYQRRFDGVRFDFDRPSGHLSAAAYMPTQGVFEESANLTIPKVQMASVTFTRPSQSREWQVFTHVYRDRRAEKARPDNMRLGDSAVDVTIAALGGSYVSVRPTRAGELDLVAWGAVELGDWYGQSQHAASFALEAGHWWPAASLTPRMRAGYLFASGDRDQNDSRHGTFFPMLPSSRQYTLSSVYTQMNVHDLFAELRLEPGRVKTMVDVHHVNLASGNDLWYHGTGADSSTGRFFGYSGRVTYGDTDLGTIVEGTADVPIVKHWSVNGYIGRMWGGDAVRRALFVDTHLLYAFVENVIRF